MKTVIAPLLAAFATTGNGGKVLAMADYMNKEVFLHSMGLTGDETKYGNRDAEHQHRSYSTYMSYEIIDSVEDSIVEEELAPVRHGRWVADGYTKWQCNQCHCPSPMYGYPKADYVRTDYCPNCGADMRGTDNDDHTEG